MYVRNKIYSGLDSSESISDTNYKEVEGITNVLLIGTDARTLDEASRADSIIIATLDNNKKDTDYGIKAYEYYEANKGQEGSNYCIKITVKLEAIQKGEEAQNP